jgi:hypothetical protein
MSRDDVLASVLVLAFATLVTAHLSIVAGLAVRQPRWRALAALVAAPLAPYWAWSGMRKRAFVWLAGAAAYTVTLLLASR